MMGGGAPGGMGAGMGPSMGAQGVPGGIDKQLKWKLMFFAGAVCVFASAVISVFYYLLNWQWAPSTFLSQLFLLMFGALMLVLDLPIPHPSEHTRRVRDNVYKFFLFMTRFMGRGMWYLFLATMCFVALWDDNIAPWLGIIIALYLVLLGVAALAKGFMLSKHLDLVRKNLIEQHRTADSFFQPNEPAKSKDWFKAMVANTAGQPDLFTDDELDYVIGALSFSPKDDGQISREEFEYWLRPGPMLLI